MWTKCGLWDLKHLGLDPGSSPGDLGEGRCPSLCLPSSKMGRCPGLPCCVSTRGTSHSLVCVDRAPWRCAGTEGKGSQEPGHRRLSEGCWLSLPSLPRTLGGSSEVSILSESCCTQTAPPNSSWRGSVLVTRTPQPWERGTCFKERGTKPKAPSLWFTFRLKGHVGLS